MKFIIFIVLMSLLISCAPLRQYEHKDFDVRVLGLDASVPIPFAQGVNIMNIRLGWVETTYSHGYCTYKILDVSQEVNHIGSVHRITYLGMIKEDAK